MPPALSVCIAGSLPRRYLCYPVCIEVGFGFCGWDVSDWLEQVSVVEPIDPFQRGVLHGLDTAPRPATVDNFGLDQSVDRLRQGIVVTVTDASDRRFDAGFCQPLF